MANRKEEREKLRAERLAAQKAQTSDERRRMILGYFVAGVLGALVIAGIVVAVMNAGGSGGPGEEEANEAAGFDPNTGFNPQLELDEREGTSPPPLEIGVLDEAAKAADCELRLDLPDDGNTHIAPDDKVPDYSTSPPTSGDHAPENIADGAYLEYPEEVNSLHSIEHGRIEIQYDPDLSEEDQLALKGVFDQDPQGMLMFPNPDMPYEVATTTWTNLMGCKEFTPETLDAVRAFRDELRGQGPEDIPL